MIHKKSYGTVVIWFGIFCNLQFMPAISQNGYKNGFIITNNNDTIRCDIKIRSNYANGKECEYRLQGGESPLYSLPGQIKAYRIKDSKYYVSRNVLIDSTYSEVFLEYLVEGVVQLFYLKTLEKDLYFIQKDGILYPLTNDLKEVKQLTSQWEPVTGKPATYLQESGKFRGTLRYLFKDAPTLGPEINKLSFKYKSLIRIAMRYHEQICSDYRCIDYSRTTRPGKAIEIYSSLVKSNVNFSFSDEKMYYSGFELGADLRFTPIKISDSWNSIVGFRYTTATFKGDLMENFYFGTDPDVYRVSKKFSLLKIPMQMEYSMSIGNFHPFISAGVGANMVFNQIDKSVILKHEYYGATDTIIVVPTFSDPLNMRLWQISFLGDLGCRFNLNKKVYIQAKYELDDWIFYLHYQPRLNSQKLSLSLGYWF